MSTDTPRGARLAACAAALAVLAAFPMPGQAADGDTVNIYSFREPALIDPLLAEFTAATGIATQVVFAKDGLIERAKAEGANSPADILLTNEFGLLTQAVEAGIARPVTSPELEAAIPATLRDREGRWFGLTRRARVIYASKERVPQDSITYEELADPKWKGKICTRSGQHTYNVALVASMLAHHGKDKTRVWLEGVRDNLARSPAGSDRDQVKGIFAGDCDISIGNTYYMGAMVTNQKQPEQKEWAASVKMLFPNAGDRGTHVNISGGLVLTNAPHPESAVKLLEFLASKGAQASYSAVNAEYPVRDDVPPSAMVAGWGTLKADPLALQEVAKLRRAASELIDEVGFDDGPRG